MEEISELLQVRRDKLKEIEDQGLEAYGRKFETNTTAQQIKDEYTEDSTSSVTIAGRIMSWRKQGKTMF